MSPSRISKKIIASNTSVTGAQTIPDATNNVRYTLVGDTTVTLPDTDELPAGTARSVTIFVKQDGTGGRTFALAAPGGYDQVQQLVNTASSKRLCQQGNHIHRIIGEGFHYDLRFTVIL